MPASALVLVLISAAMHAVWNTYYKRAEDKQAFPLFKSLFSWGFLVAAGLPAMLMSPPSGPEVYPRAALSGLCYAFYFIFMSAAFEAGDLSLVYPISRGVGPALTVLGGVLILGEKLTPVGLMGVGLIVLAVVVISAFNGHGAGRGGESPFAACAYATGVGVTIAVYGVNDAVGVTLAHPLTYLMFGVGTSLLILIPVLVRRCGRERLVQSWKREWRLYAACAVMDTASYVLYLFALRLAPTGYVTPTRSLSVVFAALMGATVLKETRGTLRVAAATVVAAGVMLVGFWG